MRRRPIGILVAALSCLLGSMLPQRVQALTGNDWQRFSSDAKFAYVAGTVDTFVGLGMIIRKNVSAERQSTNEKIILKFHDCVRRTPGPYDPIVAIVQKYMNENPGRSHKSMAESVWYAIQSECEKDALQSKGGK